MHGTKNLLQLNTFKWEWVTKEKKTHTKKISTRISNINLWAHRTNLL